jgi:dTDP-4-dehydrorhamnose reductase
MHFSRVLITGARGSLARALQNSAPQNVEMIPLSRGELDIADAIAVEAMLSQKRPDLVINGAAYNLVDKAESDGMGDALRVNALGVATLARFCREAGVPLVHFSTDYVFDGEKKTPYEEADKTGPLGVYAASKLAGENIALAASSRNFAIRVCRLFGPVEASDGALGSKPVGNFPLMMLHLAQTRPVLRVVNDQLGTPTYTPDLARGVWQLLQNAEGGLFQLSNGGAVTFDEYARLVFKIAGVECEVQSVSSEEYGAPARRPLYTVMSNEKAQKLGVFPLRDWREALVEFMSQSSLTGSK